MVNDETLYEHANKVGEILVWEAQCGTSSDNNGS